MQQLRGEALEVGVVIVILQTQRVELALVVVMLEIQGTNLHQEVSVQR